MIYIKIFFAKVFLFSLKHKLKLIFCLILFIGLKILLIDSEQNYTNISNISNKINKKLDGQYTNFEDVFIVNSKDKKIKTIFVNDEINDFLSFKHIPKYNLIFNKKNRPAFEIELDNKNTNIFIKNIYESYLNNDKNIDHNLLNKNNYISYILFNNKKINYNLNELFYNVLLIMNNLKEKDEIFDLINHINEEEISCKKYDILINKKHENLRLSILCNS